MRTANYTDLRANLKSYIDAVIDDYDTVNYQSWEWQRSSNDFFG